MKTRLAALTLCWLFAASPAFAQSAQELYQQGLGKQDLGDYQDAIRIYERVVREFPSNRRLVARAKVRMIDCWQRLGEAKAADLILEVIRDYKDQPDVVAEAKKLSERNERFKRLTDKDVLVLAEFVNTTGDAMFDQGMRQALLFKIEESPFLKVMDATQVQQALQFLRRSPDERLTPKVARDICVREQEKATLEGSIATVGTTYLIVLEAINCRTGATLARDQATARDKSGVMQALEEAVKGLRVKLGESLNTIEIEKLGRPYADGNRVTTTSLEAFQQFALGEAEFAKGSQVTAIPHYRRATELDPNFAMAFAIGSRIYANLGDTAHQQEFAARAYALVDRVTSERERLYILALHYGETGERNKQIETYEVLTRRYPRDAALHSNLGNHYRGIGDLEKAEKEFQAAVLEAPRFWLGYSNLGLFYLGLGRIEEARTVGEKAIGIGADAPMVHAMLLRIADLYNDSAAVEKEIQWFAGKPEEYTVIPLLVNRLLTLGQPQKARELAQRGERLVARLDFDSTLITRIGSLAAQIDAFKSGTLGAFQPDGLVVINAPPPGLAGAAPRALPGGPTAGPPPGVASVGGPPPILYARGQMLLTERKGQEAAAEFQKILDGKVQTWGPSYPLALVGVARGAAIAGDTARARKHYEEFLGLWKDAEADISILLEARTEYAALQAGQPVVLPPILPPVLIARQTNGSALSGTTDGGTGTVWVSEAFPAAIFNVIVDGDTLTGNITVGAQSIAIFEGTNGNGVMTFKVKSLDGQRIITFTGKNTGGEIVFTRDVEVLPGGGPGGPGLFGLNAPKTFTAKRWGAQPAR